jgi:hypothetical protein
MQTPSKPHLLAEIRGQRDALDALLARVPADQLSRPLPGDDWSIKDILAHIFAWEQVLLYWWQAGQGHEIPTDPSPNLSHEEIERLNTDFYQAHRHRPLAEVQAHYRRSYTQVMAILEAAPAAALEQPGYFPWAEGQPFASFVIGNTSDHYQEHRLQIANWLETTA